MSAICCQRAIDVDNGQSPFRQIVCLDWYDGVVSALTQCSSCGRSYAASMVAWSAGCSVRVYALGTLPEGSFARLVAALSQTSSPNWPVWIPRRINSIREALKDVVLANGPPFFLVATDSLNERLRACSTVNDAAMDVELAALIERSQQIEEGQGRYLVDLEVATSQSPEENASWFSALQIGELLSE